MQSPDVHEGFSACQTHFIASIILDPDDNDESMVDIPINALSESENYSIEVKVLWRSHKVVRVDMRMVGKLLFLNYIIYNIKLFKFQDRGPTH